MATTETEKTVILKSERRTWRVELFCEKNAVPSVRWHRQRCEVDADGKISKTEQLPAAIRSLTEIAADTVTIGGVSYTAALAAELIAAFGDKYGDEEYEKSIT